MVATVKIMRWTGSSAAPSKNDITSQTNRAATSDTWNETTGNPIPVPSGSATNYSYWVCTRLSATAAASTSITAIRWYTDGTVFGSGVALKVATASAYAQALGTTGTSGSQLTSAAYGNGWSFAQSVGTGAGQYTSAALATVTGSIGSTTGDFGDFVVYQVEVTSAASPGPTSAEQLTWQYDET